MAVQEVVVRPKKADFDPRGQAVAAMVKDKLGLSGVTVSTADIYFLEGVSEKGARSLIQSNVLREPVTQKAVLNPVWKYNPKVVKIGYKPGAMNPDAQMVLGSVKDSGVDVSAVDTAVQYNFKGPISSSQINLLFAQPPMINHVVQREIRVKPDSLKVETEENTHPMARYLLSADSDGKLGVYCGDYGFGNVEEVRAVQNYFRKLGRNPTEVELNMIAPWWSEHCGHKTFKSELEVDGEKKKPLFTRIRETSKKYFGTDVISAFADNSGVIKFFDGLALNIKGETHNSPSALEPFGGAGTGVGGLIRDVMMTGLGAKIVFLRDILCFGPWKTKVEDVLPGCLHPDYLMKRVVAGIADYGNKFGAPTLGGSMHFHPDFGAKPTVMVVGVGLLKEEDAQKGQAQPGDLVVLFGGRTGKDGVGGATFSSREITNDTAKVDSQAVQIGNPIEQKKVADAMVKITEKKAARALNDLGAAGILSGSGEMGKEIGMSIDLSEVPTKYYGLTNSEKLISEAQERFSAAVDPARLEEFMAICAESGVEARVIGRFDDSKHLNVYDGGHLVGQVSYDFLENGLPKEVRKANWVKPQFEDVEAETPKDWVSTVKQVLSHGNVCSKQPVANRYDHGVQGMTALGPYSGKDYDGPNVATVLQPLPDKPYGVVIGHGLNPILNRVDPYLGTLWACAKAVSSYIAVGGDPSNFVMNENFVSPIPTEQYLGSLDRQVDAICDFMDATKRPVISGKDSLSSTYKDIDDYYNKSKWVDVPPVVAMTVMGKIPDVEKTVTSDIKQPGSTLVLVGQLDNGMAGSVLNDVNGLVGNDVPAMDLELLPRVFKTMHSAVTSGEVQSCHDVGEGGLVAALSKMAFGGGCGVNLDMTLNGERPEQILFNETAGCFVVEVADAATAKRLFGNVPYHVLGTATAEKNLRVEVNGSELFNASVDELKAAWKQPLQEVFN